MEELINLFKIQNRVAPKDYILLNEAIQKINTHNLELNSKICSINCEYEVLLMIKLYTSGFKENYKISQTDKYCNVDFVILNLNTNKKLFVELKSRDKKSEHYNSYFIGVSKVNYINEKQFEPCVLSWTFGNNLDNIYFLEYDYNFLKTQTKSFVCGSDVYEIEKIKMNNGWSSFIQHIHNCID